MSILYERVGRRIGLILLNRPEKRNAFNIRMVNELKSLIKVVEDDSNIDVAILSGLGGNFSAGYDLNELVNLNTGLPNIEAIHKLLWPLGTRLSNRKVFIAAIDGHAAGFGYELALKCHFRVADKPARLGFMNRRFGIPILNGGSVMLPKLIGQARALDLVASGRAQPAPEALEFGVLNFVSDVGCSIGRATNLARCLAKFHNPALVHDMNSLFESTSSQETEILRHERTRSLKYLETCQPLDSAISFLEGKLGRHGKFDMGNSVSTQPVVTL